MAPQTSEMLVIKIY